MLSSTCLPQDKLITYLCRMRRKNVEISINKKRGYKLMKAYYEFGNYIVYATRHLFNIMRNDEVFAEFFPMDKNKLLLTLSDDACGTLILKTLTKEYSTNNNKFYDKYVKFDISGKDAQIDILFYLDCYCRLHNKYFNIVNKNYTERIDLDTTLGSSPKICLDYVDDYYEKFFLIIMNPKGIKNIFNNEMPATKILIDSNKTTRIVGDSNTFDIMFDNGSSICCSKTNIMLTI